MKHHFGLLRRADGGCKRAGREVEPSGRQPDGRAGVEELAHQVAHSKAMFFARLVPDEGIERVCDSAFNIPARCRLHIARPRLRARQKVRLALAAKHRCGKATKFFRERAELQSALLQRSHRRNGRNLNRQVRFEVGVEVCGGLVARKCAHTQKALPVLVLRQLGHRKRAAEHDEAVAERLVVREPLE
eukprot:scaffold14505_cov148-Isochrysis_galbana.AAC.2